MDDCIILPNGATWNNSLPLEQQTCEASSYFQQMVDTCQKQQTKDQFNRPILTVWDDGEIIANQIVTYKYQSVDWWVVSSVLTLQKK